MRIIAALLAATLALGGPALGYDDASQAVIDGLKTGKPVPIDDVAALMMGAERWCYDQKDNECAWSDIYLSVEDDTAVFEISNPWNEEVDISYINRGELRDGRFVCEIGYDWIPSVRAYGRDDGWALEGRELQALKDEISGFVDVEADHACYDYIYRGTDNGPLTITLLQRQFVDGTHQPAQDATVTLHYDETVAEGLGWYWP